MRIWPATPRRVKGIVVVSSLLIAVAPQQRLGGLGLAPRAYLQRGKLTESRLSFAVERAV
jgi:hypothetical protein